jgi:hypothetical protein
MNPTDPGPAGARDGHAHPLRPLECPEDESRYLAIDDTEEMYKKFEEHFGDAAAWKGSGHVIVVTGDRGCGKTSLSQRCVHWLKTRQQNDCEIVVLDLSDSMWAEHEDQNERIRRVFGRILGKLGSYLDQEIISELKGNSGDLDDAFYYLGIRMNEGRSGADHALPLVLVIQLPCYSTDDEVSRYFTLACPGIFFFAEIFDPEVAEKVKRQLPQLHRVKATAQHLTVGKLKPGDARLMVRQICDKDGPAPEMPDLLVNRYFEDSIDKFGMSARELSMLASGVRQLAREDGAAQVTVDHVTMYYQQAYFQGDS